MASEQRTHDHGRIRRATRWALYGSLAATAVFGGLAARSTHPHATSTSSSSSAVSSDDNAFDGAVAPQSSVQPPVTQSGGS